ncbi:MAG: hypothetical protein M5R36_04750 [Deltaproteobacteria bacterium]|nr:hypothetical protein [Deltaproteobacteria bacterium]
MIIGLLRAAAAYRSTSSGVSGVFGDRVHDDHPVVGDDVFDRRQRLDAMDKVERLNIIGEAINLSQRFGRINSVRMVNGENDLALDIEVLAKLVVENLDRLVARHEPFHAVISFNKLREITEKDRQDQGQPDHDTRTTGTERREAKHGVIDLGHWINPPGIPVKDGLGHRRRSR